MRIILKHTILAGILVMGAVSCNKNLELAPIYQSTTGNAFTNLDAYNKQLNAVYTGFSSSAYYNGNLGVDLDMLTDNLYESIETFNAWPKISNWEYVGDEGYMSSAWLQPYHTIFQANVIINGIDKFKSEDEKKYNRILGQALAARAIAHFDLLRSFADNLDRNSTGLGIVLKLTPAISFPARNTVKEVYDQLYTDLNKALGLLENTDVAINTATNRAYIDKWGVKAALAKISLYAKEYDLAIANATACLNQFPVSTLANFPSIWTDARQDEVIWAIRNNSNDGSPYPSANVMLFRSNKSFYFVHPSLLNVYDRVNDVRFSTYFFFRDNIGGSQNYGLQKYKGRTGASDNLVNYKVFRSADLLLIRAEAYARNTKPAEANTDLENLRKARITGYVHTPATGDALVNAILLERRRELVGEGSRWYDLKRSTRVVARPMAGIGNPANVVAISLPATSHRWVWPIPVEEVRANKNMKQNPVYTF